MRTRVSPSHQSPAPARAATRLEVLVAGRPMNDITSFLGWSVNTGLLTRVAEILTPVALLLAIFQTYQAKRQNDDAKADAAIARTQAEAQAGKIEDQSAKLKSLIDALSTKYVGEFPHYLDEVVGLIGRTEDELLVLSTLPLIGAVNAPKPWMDILHALDGCLRRGRRTRVKAVFANPRVRTDFFRTMFPVALHDWERWIGDPENRRKVDDFVDRYPFTGPIETAEAYFAALEAAAVDVLDRNYRGAEIREMAAPSMMSLWIADGHEAVLAIRTFAARNDSHAFATSDPQLVRALATIHAEYMAQAEPRRAGPG